MSGSVRAKTKIVITGPHKKIEQLTDVCIIYQDSVNPGHLIAHSLMTNRVGVGATVPEAYLDLVVGLARVIRYINEVDPDVELGEPAPDEVQNRYDYAHRMSPELQKRLTDYARDLLQECPNLDKALAPDDGVGDSLVPMDLKDSTIFAFDAASASADISIAVKENGQIAVA